MTSRTSAQIAWTELPLARRRKLAVIIGRLAYRRLQELAAETDNERPREDPQRPP
jgi:hypothetical protein